MAAQSKGFFLKKKNVPVVRVVRGDEFFCTFARRNDGRCCIINDFLII